MSARFSTADLFAKKSIVFSGSDRQLSKIYTAAIVPIID